MVLKIFLVCILFVVFVIYFGNPSNNKFQANSILYSRVTEKLKQIDPPQFYLCSMKSGNCWKWDGSASKVGNILKEMCKHSKNLTDLDTCIENNSYANEEMFFKIVDSNGTDMLNICRQV